LQGVGYRPGIIFRQGQGNNYFNKQGNDICSNVRIMQVDNTDNDGGLDPLNCILFLSTKGCLQ
jgi:hypothetical protein